MLFRRLDDLPFTLTGEWREMLPSLAPLRSAVRDAQRVMFARAAAAACHDLASDRSSLERARPQIFAPFERTWIEMDGVPDIGILWQSEPGEMQRGTVKLLTWPTAHPVPVIYDCEADINNPMRPPVLLTVASHAALRAAGGGSERGPYLGTQAETGEWIAAPMLAAFAMLATKGLTNSVPQDMSKLNHTREQGGKYPLLGYDEVRLNLDVERQVGRTMARGTGDMPLHQVRAHLRLIASGRVVIVRSHHRGNPARGIKRSHYTVQIAEDLAK